MNVRPFPPKPLTPTLSRALVHAMAGVIHARTKAPFAWASNDEGRPVDVSPAIDAETMQGLGIIGLSSVVHVLTHDGGPELVGACLEAVEGAWQTYSPETYRAWVTRDVPETEASARDEWQALAPETRGLALRELAQLEERLSAAAQTICAVGEEERASVRARRDGVRALRAFVELSSPGGGAR